MRGGTKRKNKHSSSRKNKGKNYVRKNESKIKNKAVQKRSKEIKRKTVKK